jgi:hypothetical protein
MITPALWKAAYQVPVTRPPSPGETQYLGTVAGAADGSYTAVWTDLNGPYGSPAVLVARKFDAAGNPLTGDVPLTGDASQSQPQIAVLANQTLALAYYGDSAGNTFLKEFDPSLNLVSTISIETGALFSFSSAITAFPNGGIFVSYNVQATASDYPVMGRAVSPSGVAGPEVTLFDNGVQSYQTSLATLDNGNFVAVIQGQSVGQPDLIYDIHYEVVAEDGSVVRPVALVPGAGAGYGNQEPDVAALHSGGFAIVWTHGTSAASKFTIDLSVFDQSGNVVRNDTVISTNGTQDQSDAHVTPMDDGGFLVTWEDSVTTVAQRFDGTGNKIGEQVVVHKPTESISENATLADGRTVVSFDAAPNGGVDNALYDTRTNVTGHATGHDLFGDGSGDTLILSATTAGGSPGGVLTMVDLSATGTLTQIGLMGTDHSVVGSGDFNHDGRADILVQYDHDGLRELDSLIMGATQVVQLTNLGPVGLDWQIDGTGDFNGDGTRDILMERVVGSSKQFEILGMQNNAVTSITIAGTVPQDYQVDGIGDFNHDGIDDILIHHDSAGSHQLQVLFQGNYTTQSIGNAGSVGTEWNIDGVGDFNHDGYADILGHYDTATQRILADFVNPGASGSFSVKTLGPVGKNIQIDGIGDMTGDGTPDISAHYDSSGTLRTHLYFEMHNSTVTNIVTAGVVGHEWIVS